MTHLLGEPWAAILQLHNRRPIANFLRGGFTKFWLDAQRNRAAFPWRIHSSSLSLRSRSHSFSMSNLSKATATGVAFLIADRISTFATHTEVSKLRCWCAASNNCSSCTSLSASTGRGVYTNDFVTSLVGTVKDENLTPSAGCTEIEQDPKYFPGNLVSAKVVSSTGVQSCGATWSPADNAGIMIANIKTANSAMAGSSGNKR